jgi:putative endonuclease
MYYIYVIESAKDHQWYTGMTGDLRSRMTSHLKGQVTSTSHRLPLRLVYYEASLCETDARRRERYLKSGKGKRYLKQRLSAWITADRQWKL